MKAFAPTAQFFCFTVFLFTAQLSLTAQDSFTDDSGIKTFLHDSFDGQNAGMVIGLVDEHGSRIFAARKLDNGTSQKLNGDTDGHFTIKK